MGNDYWNVHGDFATTSPKAIVKRFWLDDELNRQRSAETFQVETGLVDDADLGLKFIANNRTVRGGFTVSGNLDIDVARGKSEIARMRLEAQEIPEDPFVVFPENAGSSHEIKTANSLPFENAVDALMPAMSGVDFVGIWANGRIFRGNANNLGQKHWFETESFSLDYSLVTPEHQMVKGSFAGGDWNQNEYESYVKRSR